MPIKHPGKTNSTDCAQTHGIMSGDFDGRIAEVATDGYVAAITNVASDAINANTVSRRATVSWGFGGAVSVGDIDRVAQELH